MSGFSAAPRLVGRRSECDRLRSLAAALAEGRSQVLVLRGEAGIGKSALLDFLLELDPGWTVGRASGVPSETELPFAGLHQLCAPFLDRLNALPVPQQDALGTAFGVRSGAPPDRFLVGLGVLSLLAKVAEAGPLLCVIDDAQWLDEPSVQALEFVARRLPAEPVGMVFAARESEDGRELAGLPELALGGLKAADAAALLESVVPGEMDRRVRDRIVAESRGNPLALLELPRGLSAADLAFGGQTVGDATPLVHRLEQVFLHQAEPLSRESWQLLLTAAAEPVADVPLLERAAERLGIGPDAATAAEAAGLLELGDSVRFRHPLVRSAVYRAASSAERREVHRALADVTDPDLDPDRRAWHHAHAASGPDEAIASELEETAGRAMSHAGVAAAGAFLEQAAALTPDPARRLRRLLDAAEAKTSAGALDDASALLVAAEEQPLGEGERAHVDLLRARISFANDPGDGALPLLLAAAHRLEPLDPRLARDTYLDAISAALLSRRRLSPPRARQVAESVLRAPQPEPSGTGDALLDGLAVWFTEGYASAVPLSRRAAQKVAAQDLPVDEALRVTWLSAATAASLWDDTTWDVLTRRHLEFARRSGALSVLPLALNSRAVALLFTGDLAEAAALVDETHALLEGTTARLAPFGEIALLAVRGAAERAAPLIQECVGQAGAPGEGGVAANVAMWARAVLYNGLGRYREAVDAARGAADELLELGSAQWALAELVEAAARSGETRAAEAGLEQLSAMATASGSDWALGIEASRAALCHRGRAAEDLYSEGIDRLSRTTVRLELARAQLLYGEWLRREYRPVDARAQLRTAHEALSAMGAEAFANRARHELLATGEKVRKRTPETRGEFTAQEGHIAGLAAQGLTNAEIGAMLYISPRTVEWHLRNIFVKLGVRNRRELRRSLPEAYRTPT